MKILASTVFAIVTLIACSKRIDKNVELIQPSLKITALQAKFPLHLDEVNLNQKDVLHLNDGINARIELMTKESYDSALADSLHSYVDTYINTIRLYDSAYTVFLVLLKDYPVELLYSKALFYNNTSKEFVDGDFKFKIYALYDYDSGKLVPSNLKTLFKINSPEIDIIDYNHDGHNDFKFVRLWHNGTFNAVHTTVIDVSKNKIDTLFFEEKAIGNEDLLKPVN